MGNRSTLDKNLSDTFSHLTVRRFLLTYGISVIDDFLQNDQSCDLGYGASTHGIPSGSIIEFIGNPGTGKTHLVYWSVISILFKDVNISNLRCPDKGSGAVIIDCDYKYDRWRFTELAYAYLCDLLGVQMNDSIKTYVNAKIDSKLLVLHPQTVDELQCCLNTLEDRLSAYSGLNNCHLGMICITSICSFFWEPNAFVEIHRTLRILRKKLHSLGSLGVLTTWNILPRGKSCFTDDNWKSNSHPFRAASEQFVKARIYLKKVDNSYCARLENEKGDFNFEIDKTKIMIR